MRWMYNCFFNSKMLMLMVAIGSDYHFEEKKINKPIWVFSWNTQYVHNCIRSISFKNKKKLIIKSRLLSIWSMTMNPFYFWYRYIFWLMITFILIIYQEAQWPHLSTIAFSLIKSAFGYLLYRISGSAWTIYQSRSFTNKTRAGFQNFSPYILMLNINPLLFLGFFSVVKWRNISFSVLLLMLKFTPPRTPGLWHHPTPGDIQT